MKSSGLSHPSSPSLLCTSTVVHWGVAFLSKCQYMSIWGSTHSVNVGWLAFKCWLTYLIIYTAFGVYWNASLQLLILEALESIAASQWAL